MRVAANPRLPSPTASLRGFVDTRFAIRDHGVMVRVPLEEAFGPRRRLLECEKLSRRDHHMPTWIGDPGGMASISRTELPSAAKGTLGAQRLNLASPLGRAMAERVSRRGTRTRLPATRNHPGRPASKLGGTAWRHEPLRDRSPIPFDTISGPVVQSSCIQDTNRGGWPVHERPRLARSPRPCH